MRQPDADTDGRNLRPVLTPTQGLPSEMVRDLAPGLASGTDQADAGSGRRWPTSSATGCAGRRASGSIVVGRPAPRRNPGTSATRYQGCARPPGPGHRARQPPLGGVPQDHARELPPEPVLGPLLRCGSTMPEDAKALEVCDEC
jgi:hypothetical protein